LGGKRIVLCLSLLAYGTFSEANPEAILKQGHWLSKVFHNFTLMHDDIMDDAPLRPQGEETVH